MTCAPHYDARSSAHFIGVRTWNDNFVTHSCSVGRSEQQPFRRFQLTAEGELAVELGVGQPGCDVVRRGCYLPRGEENSQGDRKIEPASLLRKIGGREIHRDPPVGKLESRVDERGAHALLALPDHCRR